MPTLLQDLRYSVRLLAKSRGFTVAAIITLGLGIGITGAVFSIVSTVLLKPLPFKSPGNLMTIAVTKPEGQTTLSATADFLHWQKQNKSFDQLAAFRSQMFTLTEVDEPERIPGVAVTPNLFDLLGTEPYAGRLLLPQDGDFGADPVVILGYGLWQRRFGSDPNLVGLRIKLNGNSYRVVGVAPPYFEFPIRQLKVELWTPLIFSQAQSLDRGNHILEVIGRLRPDVSPAHAQAELEMIARPFEQQYSQNKAGYGVLVVPLHERLVGKMRVPLYILFGAALFLLLITCVNIADLLMVRASVRQREFAIRTALGAGRLRVIKQLLTESLVLALAGGSLGFIITLWAKDIILLLGADEIPRIKEAALDVYVIGFSAVIPILTAMLFGLAPALFTSRLNPIEWLKEGGATNSPGPQRFRGFLVVSEVAIALLLLIGAGLMMKSLLRIQSIDPGFNSDNVLTMGVSLSRTKYNKGTQVTTFYSDVIQRIEAIQGVQFVGATTGLPIQAGGGSASVKIQDGGMGLAAESMTMDYQSVTPAYFRAMGIPLLEGRTFTEQDSETAPRVAIIDHFIASRFFAGRDPIGQQIIVDDAPLQVVGIVGQVRHKGVLFEPEPIIYVPHLQQPIPSMLIVVRTAGDPLALSLSVKKAVWMVDKDQPISNIKTMSEMVSDSIAQPRLIAALLAIFAGISFIMAAVGIYGVMSYTVAQQKREIGIRMALGAQHLDILKLILGRGLVLSVAGIFIGLGISLAMTRILSNLLYEISTTDAYTFFGMSLFLFVVALAASCVPALKATRVDPALVLRYE